MGNLIAEALSMGWMAIAILTGLLVYFQVSISDPSAKKRAVFKTFIGIISTFLLFVAIANYKTNFYGESRLLPVSLVMITATSFIMALYFTNLSALLKIGGFMFFVAAFLSGYGNWLPQVEGGFPPVEEKLDFNSMTPQQLADEGEKIIFGGIGKNKEQGAIGKGQCPLCHAFHAGMLGERAPNLLGLVNRSKERLEDPKYSKGNPAKREYSVKEAFPGSGTAENAQEYIAESHACPSCYVVEGYGVKGTNDRESPMPAIHKPPISLSLPELAAVDTWMYVREGLEPPSFEEIVKSYEKFIPEGDRPQLQEDKPAGGAASSLMADGSEPVDQIFAKAQCVACHTIPGIPGAVGTIGPKLEEGTTAAQRIKAPDYKGTAKSPAEYIMESIVDPSAYVVKPFPDNTMPKVFGQKLSAGALKKIVDYLSQVKVGAPPPKIS
ncbi:MAG: c-type cytochrome [Nitrospira sp.]|nr:c-type cytochrome [Nitrospira sp.]MCP9461479.1 c-type cytochrome [Nitrospira sp.]MCP9474253.1 c-type cytochrome [Nitrospira sp.]